MPLSNLPEISPACVASSSTPASATCSSDKAESQSECCPGLQFCPNLQQCLGVSHGAGNVCGDSVTATTSSTTSATLIQASTSVPSGPAPTCSIQVFLDEGQISIPSFNVTLTDGNTYDPLAVMQLVAAAACNNCSTPDTIQLSSVTQSFTLNTCGIGVGFPNNLAGRAVVGGEWFPNGDVQTCIDNLDRAIQQCVMDSSGASGFFTGQVIDGGGSFEIGFVPGDDPDWLNDSGSLGGGSTLPQGT